METQIEISMAPGISDTGVFEWITEFVISKVNELGVPHGHVVISNQEYQDTKWAGVKKSYDYSWIKCKGMPDPVLVIAPSLDDKHIDKWMSKMHSYTYYDQKITVKPDIC